MIELPACVKDDEIEYRVKNEEEPTKGTVKDRTDLFITVSIPKRFGSYPVTIHRNDLITGDITILAINSTPCETPENTTPPPDNGPAIKGLKIGGLRRLKKAKEGVKSVAKKKIERPSIETLAQLFEKAGYNISRAAEMCEPQVSKATMGRWLKATGIIEPTSKATMEAPPNGELRQAWEDAERSLVDLGKKYTVTSAIAKQWLLDAGIIFETFTGIETTDFTPEDEEMIPYNIVQNPDNVEESHDHEIIKKLIDFCQAPFIGRIEEIEETLDVMAGSLLEMEARPQPKPDNIRKLAILIAAVLEVI